MSTLLGRVLAAEAGGMAESELLAGAEARIEKYRKADAAISVMDAASKPVAGVKVAVEQTRHAFLFGCNIFCLNPAENTPAQNGGFILSTGDQCGRDTPDANIREMVNVAKEFGAYPLDMSAIDKGIKALERIS